MSDSRQTPIHPEQALKLYLKDKATSASEATVRSHRSRLGHFIDWCDNKGIENLNNLTGRDLHEFKIDRQEGINKVTLKTQLDTLRVFIRFCETIDAVPEGFSKKIQSPNLSGDEGQRSDIVESEKAEKILEYMNKYEYCSLRHVFGTLLWRTGLRVGATHGLDLDDFDAENQSIEVVHRPDTETTLKNKKDGERFIAIDSDTTELLEDWIEDQRPNVQDEYGRNPLLATHHGRVHIETLRKYSYQITRPCFFTGDCPEGRDIDECEASSHDSASKCPASTAPHSWRRGHITYLLREDTPKTVVSDRVNTSPDVIDEHYNQMTEEEKMDQRRDYLDF